jgi:hypothetical protein
MLDAAQTPHSTTPHCTTPHRTTPHLMHRAGASLRDQLLARFTLYTECTLPKVNARTSPTNTHTSHTQMADPLESLCFALICNLPSVNAHSSPSNHTHTHTHATTYAGVGRASKPVFLSALHSTTRYRGPPPHTHTRPHAQVADPRVALHLSGLQASAQYDNVVPVGTMIGAKSTVAAGCVLGDSCVLGDKTSIKRSVLGAGCR